MSEFVMNTRAAPALGAGAGVSASKTSRGNKPEPMDDNEFAGAFRGMINDAEEYIDGHIAPLRAAATRYYRGEPLGNEEHGRSQVVMTEVRDAVLAILPSLMRIFVSGENVVEFVPSNGNTIDLADQQTAYVNYVLMQDNPGFLTLYNCFKDALIRKSGVIKWRWSEDETVTETRFTGIPDEQVAVLQEDKTVQVISLEEGEPLVAPSPGVDPQTGQPVPEQEIPMYDVHIRRRFPKNRLVIECLPPEEYLINRDARDANNEYGYTLQAHRSFKSVSELVAMGFDEELILEKIGSGDMFSMNFEQQARNPAVMGLMGQYDTPDDSMRRGMFIEAYMRVDKDGDGIAELRRIRAIGDNYHILDDEVVDEAPFAMFCPDPEPHMVIGQSVADQTMDLQNIKSNMVRNLLDSLSGSIHPRTVVVEGQANLDDVMNTEQGAIIRARNPAAVTELTKPFIGQQALPVIAYMDMVKSKRTGLTDASQGLDPAMLQSATHSAVTATVSGAQERIELYARIFAETGMKRLCQGVAKCLRQNQDQGRVVKLHGSWVQVDPRNWEGELEVVPNVAIGKGTDQDKIAFLSAFAQKQELIIQTLGPTNPLADLTKYRATLAQIITLAGFKDANRYLGQIPPDYIEKLKNQPPPPNPQLLLVQVEQQKVQQDYQLKIAKHNEDQMQALRKDQLQREKMHLDFIAKMATEEAAHGREVNAGMIDRLLQHHADMSATESQHVTATQQMLLSHAADVHSTNTSAAVDHASNQMQADVQRQAAAAKAAAGPSGQ